MNTTFRKCMRLNQANAHAQKGQSMNNDDGKYGTYYPGIPQQRLSDASRDAIHVLGRQ